VGAADLASFAAAGSYRCPRCSVLHEHDAHLIAHMLQRMQQAQPEVVLAGAEASLRMQAQPVAARTTYAACPDSMCPDTSLVCSDSSKNRDEAATAKSGWHARACHGTDAQQYNTARASAGCSLQGQAARRTCMSSGEAIAGRQLDAHATQAAAARSRSRGTNVTECTEADHQGASHGEASAACKSTAAAGGHCSSQLCNASGRERLPRDPSWEEPAPACAASASAGCRDVEGSGAVEARSPLKADAETPCVQISQNQAGDGPVTSFKAEPATKLEPSSRGGIFPALGPQGSLVAARTFAESSGRGMPAHDQGPGCHIAGVSRSDPTRLTAAGVQPAGRAATRSWSAGAAPPTSRACCSSTSATRARTSRSTPTSSSPSSPAPRRRSAAARRRSRCCGCRLRCRARRSCTQGALPPVLVSSAGASVCNACSASAAAALLRLVYLQLAGASFDCGGRGGTHKRAP
jgi:hypothetical protein